MRSTKRRSEIQADTAAFDNWVVREVPRLIAKRNEERRQFEEKLRLRELALRQRMQTLDGLRQMNAVEFETAVGSLYLADGWEVFITPQSGDRGIDLVIIKDGKKFAVQCKKHKATVSEPMVREFYGSFVGRFTGGIFVTTSSYSRACCEWARKRKKKLTLVNGETLASLMAITQAASGGRVRALVRASRITSKMAHKLQGSDFLKQWYHATSVNPANWPSTAIYLRHAASIIEEKYVPVWELVQSSCPEELDNMTAVQREDMGLINPWCLLAGHSLEVMMKGLIIGNAPSHYEPGQNGWKQLTNTHDLLCLSEWAALGELTQEERNLMDVLRRQVVWEAKYPTPKREHEMDSTIPNPLSWRSTFQTLFDKMNARYQSLL